MEGISDNETKAVLELRDRFSNTPVVFDVGSNQGGWTDIVIDSVDEMHLFEPNEWLLIYTRVKYCSRSNVFYVDRAVTATPNETIDFYYFTNENNGLSATYDNPKWDYLPKKQRKVGTVSLDQYWGSSQQIDMIKIDVEGKELEVLRGAMRLLNNGQIKFLQVEYSEHYEFLGVKFADLIRFMEGFGYGCYSFDSKFERVNADEFVEDYRLVNFWFGNPTHFTQDWNAEFKKNTKGLKVETALEIGCFEGLTTNYICENLLKEGGRVICVDPLTDEYLPGHKDNDIFVGQYKRFMRNTSGKPVQLIRKKSADAISELKDLRFGLIYVDGDHTEDGVFSDAVMYWNLLLDSPVGHGGYMLFDDYGQSEETRRGVDRFLETQKGNFDLLVKDYQVLIQRLC